MAVGEDGGALGTRAVGGLAVVALAWGLACAGAAVACGPAKPPMTPDNETNQQLPPEVDAAAAPAASASPTPASK